MYSHQILDQVLLVRLRLEHSYRHNACGNQSTINNDKRLMTFTPCGNKIDFLYNAQNMSESQHNL